MTRAEQAARREAIIDAYRELGTLDAVGKQFGITREGVRQIIATYERRTGHKIERSGNALLAARREEQKIIWRCADCGAERRVVPSAHRPNRCQKCFITTLRIWARKHLSDELIADTINRLLAGEKFYPLALAAGYPPKGTHNLTCAVYRHLIRSGDGATIAAIWRRGVPGWLRSRYGDPPPAQEAA